MHCLAEVLQNHRAYIARMRRRLASRILVFQPSDAVLLMHYSHKQGPLGGKDYWSLPGGELEPGESFAAAAIRELREETGIICADPGTEIAYRDFAFQLYDGEQVIAEEHFFAIHVDETDLTREFLVGAERDIVTDYQWWLPSEINATDEIIYPKDLYNIIHASSRG